jgi:glycine betaine catabolism B
VRHYADIIFREGLFARAEKDPNFHLVLTVTRDPPADARVRSGRIDASLITDVLGYFGGAKPAHTYVCGANAFVDVASRLLLDIGVPFPTIKTERYGGDPARDAAAPVPGA